MNPSNDAHADPGRALQRLQDAMRRLVQVPKKDVDAKIAAERREKRRRKPA